MHTLTLFSQVQNHLLLSLGVLTIFTAASPTLAGESKSLLQRIGDWRYPDAKMSGATMQDANTADANGQRTIPSIFCSVELTTPAPLSKVLEHYENLANKRQSEEKALGTKDDQQKASKAKLGRSVMKLTGSDERPVEVHVLCINEGNVSTTLVISRHQDESQTHIAWTQYEKMPIQ